MEQYVELWKWFVEFIWIYFSKLYLFFLGSIRSWMSICSRSTKRWFNHWITSEILEEIRRCSTSWRRLTFSTYFIMQFFLFLCISIFSLQFDRYRQYNSYFKKPIRSMICSSSFFSRLNVIIQMTCRWDILQLPMNPPL